MEIKKATNPKQYDYEELNWSEVNLNYLWKIYLENLKTDWKNKDVLEIGSGTGWFADELKKGGANVVAIEPSTLNFAKSKENFPEVNFLNKSFQEYKPNRKFDYVYAIMVFSHFDNLESIFKKIRDLLKNSGQLRIIVPDFKYDLGKKEKNIIEKINEEECIITKKRDFGTIIDIIRKIVVYQMEAQKAGLRLFEDKKLIKEGECFARLLSFKQF